MGRNHSNTNNRVYTTDGRSERKPWQNNDINKQARRSEKEQNDSVASNTRARVWAGPRDVQLQDRELLTWQNACKTTARGTETTTSQTRVSSSGQGGTGQRAWHRQAAESPAGHTERPHEGHRPRAWREGVAGQVPAQG